MLHTLSSVTHVVECNPAVLCLYRCVLQTTVPSDDVRIMVIANLMLSPPDAYVLTHAQVKYDVELLKHSKVTPIAMPSSQYYLEVVDTDVGTLNKKTSVVTAQEVGTTEIVLKDKSILSWPKQGIVIDLLTFVSLTSLNVDYKLLFSCLIPLFFCHLMKPFLLL